MSASREKKVRAQEREQGGENPSLKKRQRQQSYRRAVVTIIAIVFILGLATLFVIGSGIIPANVSAVTLSGIKITPAELNYHYVNSYYEDYYYGYLLNYLSSYYDVSNPFKLDDVPYTETETLRDYFMQYSMSSLKSVVALSEEAKKQGVALTDKENQQIESEIAAVKSAASKAGQSTKSFLEERYGRGMTEKGLRNAMERVQLSQLYTTKIVEGYERGDEEITQYYNEHRADFEYVTYHAYSFDRKLKTEDGAEEPSDEEKSAYDAAQKEKAEDMLAKATDSASFKDLSLGYAPADDADTDDTGDEDDADDGSEESNEAEEDNTGDENSEDENSEDADSNEDEDEEEDEDKDSEEATDDTLKENLKVSSVSDEALRTYLLDTVRAEGDKTIIETDSAYMVVLFVNRNRHDYNTKNVRHILIGLEKEDGTKRTAEEARAEAEALLAQWQEGDATEESFTALAKEKSEDGGSKEKGGLYEKVYKEQMVETFNDWVFDESRKQGDTGLVDTTYGTHIMYFIGDNEVYWKIEVTSTIDSEAFTAMRNGLVDALDVKESKFGMGMVA